MMIANMFMQNVASAAKDRAAVQIQPQTQEPDKGAGFDSYLKNAQKPGAVVKSQKDAANTAAAKKRTQPKNSAESAESSQNSANTAEGASKAASSSVKSTGEIETRSVEKQDGAETSDADDDIINELSERLGIPVEALAEILQMLNIMPQDLVNQEERSLFVQKLTGAENAAELLTMPDVKEIFVKIDGVMSKFEDAAKAAESVAFNETLEGQFADTQTSESLLVPVEALASAVKPVSDELNTAKTSGDEIVLDKSASEETSGEGELVMNSVQAGAEQAETDTKADQGDDGTDFGWRSSETPAAAGDLRENVQIGFNQFLNVTAGQEVDRAAHTVESIRNIDAGEVVEQIVSRIKVEVKADVSEVKILLKPENLGEVQMKIVARNGVVTAQFVAENQRVKEALESGFSSLKDALNQKGVNIQELHVSVGQNGSGQAGERFFNEGRRAFAGIRQVGADEIQVETENHAQPDNVGLYSAGLNLRA